MRATGRRSRILLGFAPQQAPMGHAVQSNSLHKRVSHQPAQNGRLRTRREAALALLDAGADPRARNAAGRCAADLAAAPELARLLAAEQAWLAGVGAPRSCHVLLAGAGAGAWQGPAKCRFDAVDGCVSIAAGGGSPPPSPVKQSRLKRLLGAAKAPQAAGAQRVALDGARLVVLDARSLSIELPRGKAPDASLVATQRPRVARLLVWLNDEEGDAGALRSSLERLIWRAGGELAQARASFAAMMRHAEGSHAEGGL